MPEEYVHLEHPAHDTTICGMADEGGLSQNHFGTDLEFDPPMYGDVVTCPACLAVVAHCIKYAAQHNVQRIGSRRPQSKGSAQPANR